MIKGVTNMIFGGDGVFLAQLRGPGKVYLQSLPLANLAHALLPYLGRETAQAGAAGGVTGAVLRGLNNT